MPHELTKKKKKKIAQQWTISQLVCDMPWKVDFMWQPVQLLDWEEVQKHFLSQTCTKKVMVTVGLTHYGFLNPSKTIASEKYAQQINEMYQKLQCLQPALVNRKGQIFSTTTPKHTSHHQCVKSWMNWATKFCLTCLIHLTPHNWLPSLQKSQTFFVGKMLPQSTGDRKCFLRINQILKYGFLCYGNKQAYSSLAKMYWL